MEAFYSTESVPNVYNFSLCSRLFMLFYVLSAHKQLPSTYLSDSPSGAPSGAPSGVPSGAPSGAPSRDSSSSF